GSPADLALFSLRAEATPLWDAHGQRRVAERRLHVEATVRAGVVYHPDELIVETEEEITRRCRVRGPRVGRRWDQWAPEEGGAA
ncbi:MAG TPA: hypothetical protein VK689_23240, partial [Armatimonadota bacterium]|nr:hypothetical protein [Armatimonadota bacterium]